MFPSHTSRRANRGQPPQHDYPSQHHQQSVAPSWDYQSSPPYSTQYPGHTVPGYAYPSQHGGSSHGGSSHGMQQPPSVTEQSGQFQERAPYPQWNSSRMQRGYEREFGGSQDGNHLDGSQHFIPTSNSDGAAESYPTEPIQRVQADPSERYQQYRYQSTEEPIVQPEPSAQSNRYYSQPQDTPADYQPYIPERTPRSFNNMTYNKWTPPPKLRQFISPDAQVAQGGKPQDYPEATPLEQVAHSDHYESHSESYPQQEYVSSAPPAAATQNGTSEQTYYPGHPAYKWTPPVVLQVFQEPPSQPPVPDAPISSKYASHSHHHVEAGAHSLAAASIQSSSQEVNSLAKDFVDWAKLQPSQQVIARLAQEGIRGDTIRNSTGNSLLHSACEVGNLSLIYSLVEMYDAHQFSTFNHEGMQPLHVACRHNMKFVLTFLVKNNIVTGTELTDDGDSPLHIACRYNATEVLSYLLNILPSHLLWTANKKGLFPFHVAALEGNLRVLQILAVAAKSEISRADTVEGRTCLHWAAVHRHYDVIKFLIQDSHADIHHVDVFGHTADQIHSDLVIIYLIHGKFPRDGDHDHDHSNNIGTPPASHSKSYVAPAPPSPTPALPVAAQANEAKLAASAQRSLNIINSKEKDTVEPTDNPSATATTAPVAAEDSAVVKASSGVTEKPVVVGKLNVKDNWIKNSVDKEKESVAVTSGEGSATSAAAAGDHQENGSATIAMTPETIAKLFDWVAVDNKISDLEATLGVTPEIKVDVNSIKHPETGESLLHTACRKGHLAVAQFLVEGVGSDPNSVDGNGATPLHDAVVGSSVLIVRYLVKYCGAMLDVRNSAGQTALEISEGLEPTDDHQEIARIISKAVGKSPEKRTKIDLPVYQPK